MNSRISTQLLLALAAAAAAPAATITGVVVAPNSTAGTLPTAIVVDNTSSPAGTKGFKVTRDSATKNLSLDAGEFLMDSNIPPSAGTEYFRSVTFDPMTLKMEWKQRVSGADTVQTASLRSQMGLYLDHTNPAGTTFTSKALSVATQLGTLFKAQGGTTNKFTQFQTDISSDPATGPTSIIETNGQHGTVANNNFSSLPILNTPATYLWSGTYSNPGATTASGSSDFAMLSFGGAGNKLKLYKDPVNRAGIAGAATPTIVMDPLYGTIDLVGTVPGITVNGTPFLSSNFLRVGGASTAGRIVVGAASTANATNAAAFGNNATAAGTGSFATGLGTIADGQYSIVGGTGTWTFGDYAMAMGNSTMAEGHASAALGYNTQSLGNYSLATGESTKATGHYSVALGNTTLASGAGSFAQGVGTKARAIVSTAMGESTDTWFVGQTTVGRYSLTPAAYTSDPAPTSAATDTVFVVGGGTGPSARSNALEVQANGNVKALGTVQAAGGTFTAPVAVTNLTASGTVQAAGATFTAPVTVTNLTASGTVQATGGTFSGPIILTGTVAGDIPMYVTTP